MASTLRSPALAAYDRFKQTRFFASLDGLRAASVLGVIWHHATANESMHAFLREGHKGVDLFFVISGFLIVTLLLRSKEKRGTFSLPAFWARRSLRLFPVFYTVLSIYVILVWLFETDATIRQAFFHNLPAFATFTSNWFVDLENARVIFYFAWSLAAEEQFYLIWPWFERYLPSIKALWVAFTALIGTQGLAFLYWGQNPQTLELPVRMLLSVPVAILLGVILAHLFHLPSTFGFMHRFLGRRGSALFCALVTVIVLSSRSWLGPLHDLALALAMMLLVGACVIREDNDLAAILIFPAVVWIGKISYGMYLLHMLGVNAGRRVAAAMEASIPYLDFFFGWVITIILASLSFVFFESRFLALKDRFFRPDPA